MSGKTSLLLTQTTFYLLSFTNKIHGTFAIMLLNSLQYALLIINKGQNAVHRFLFKQITFFLKQSLTHPTN